MQRFIALCLLALIAQGSATDRADAQSPQLPLKLSVEATRECQDALVSFPIAAGNANLRLHLVETTAAQKKPVAVQFDSAAGRIWWVAEGRLAAGEKRTYRLEAGRGDMSSGVEVAISKDTIEISANQNPLLRYHKTHVEPEQGVNPRYGRSGHLHPVWTRRGVIVTDELPPDHLHQSGIFLAYTKTKFEDRDVDFWNLAGGKGRVRFKQFQAATSGPLFGEFQVEHEHVDLTADSESKEIGATSGGKAALREVWQVRAWNAGADAGYWLLDITSKIQCASDSPLQLPEYHYGGMAIRGARSWKPDNVHFFTSEGDERIKGNHTRPRWCDMSGLVEGQTAGIALLTHPGNFRFPEPLRIHPTMPYMVYTPSFLGDWEIKPGTTHQSHYRFIVHDGPLSAETLDRIWQNYSQPLEARAE